MVVAGVHAMPTINRILAPTDFSEDSANALEYAEDLARKYGAELILLHIDQIITPIAIGPAPGAGYDPTAIEAVGRVADEQRAIAQRELEKMTERLKATGLKVRGVLKIGTPFLEIVTTAKSEAADLIVMGTHGRTGIAHILMGSVAERVVRKAPCPVLTVRHPDRKFQHPLDG